MNFCTIIGKDYIIKGLALYNSLKKHAKYFNLWVCCMDETAFSILTRMKLDNMRLIQLQSVEDAQLLSIKSIRTSSEYCWTIKSSWVLYLLNNHPEIDSIVFIDSDLFFFSDPTPIFSELEKNSILICSQHDREEVEIQFGKYQAGFLGFKKDHTTFSVLRWWRDRCIEWCSTEQGLHDRWGDQKYLDQWPSLTPFVKVTENWGIDAAVWSAINNISIRKSEVYIKEYKLICYHFCCVTIFNENEFDLWKWPNWKIDDILIEHVYLPYLNSLKNSMKLLRNIGVIPSSLINIEYDKKNSSNYYSFLENNK